MADQPPHLDKEMKSKISILDYIVSKTQAAIETDEQDLLLRQLKAVKTVMESCKKLRIEATQSVNAINQLFEKKKQELNF